MKRSNLNWMLALGALWLIGCEDKKAPVVMQVQGGGKVFLHPQQGDVVQWKDSSGKAFPVTFPPIGTSPCQESANPTSTCTLKLGGVYPYDCAGCADPVIIVGSDGGPLQKAVVLPKGNVLDSQSGVIYCDAASKAAKVYKDPLQVAASTGGANSKIQWFPYGNSGITAFTVTLQPGTCQEATIDQSQNICTLLAGAPKSQTYNVTADVCSSPGTAVLNVQ